MTRIQFEATILMIDATVVLKLPKSSSRKLPSRGLVMVAGTLNDAPFQAPLEPDGVGSHWLKVDKGLLKAAGAAVGETVALALEPVSAWPEPTVPADLKRALATAPLAQQLWRDITPMARWDWVRWIGATKNPATRQRRIEITLSKFEDGKRRPCCFDRSKCADPTVSSNGILLEPAAGEGKG